MPLVRIIIKNYKSIRDCDISLSELNILIGENGTGKTNLLDAINYFYCNLTDSNTNEHVFDENNHYSNEVRITLVYDLTEFMKISKSNTDELLGIFFGDKTTKKTKYHGYYKTIISMASKTIDKRIYVELSQIKGQPIRWNYKYEDRLIFKSLFPIFYIDTRNLDVTEWGYVWDVLGELGKVSHEERKTIESKINEILDESKEMSRKLKGINGIFNAADVSVKTARSKEFAKNLTKVFFSGETIRQNGKRLDYYSTGTNSVKYIELLLKSIDEISRTKMKEPIVLFDEPEISLHTNYLDELVDAMLDVNERLSIVVSTHSSRLTKNIITKSDAVTLYNIKLIDKYSRIQRMKKFPQYSPASKHRVTDEHINSYFSRAILFVEGETELELFANPYIKLLFAKLKKVDVFQAMSQQPILNIMNPKLTNMQTPYICLIDMDKAINFDRENKKLSLKNEYFKPNLKEQFQYRDKHQTEDYLYHQRKRINAMVEKLRVHYYLPLFSCNDLSYDAFVAAVHQYLLAYNVYSFCTTIEGALINPYTADFALEYLRSKKKAHEYAEFIGYLEELHKTDQINVLRIVFNGKSDLLQRKAALQNIQPAKRMIIERVMIGDKTSGWVSEYLDSFFQSSAQIEGAISVKKFQQCLQDEERRKVIIKEFKRNFPELLSLIERLCDMICE